ncbi:MAG: hypothetical protein IJZ34_04345 [Lachnospiraceae bacterium]|nr:hypothetical protein [Lachnospiraceae bacterium]
MLYTYKELLEEYKTQYNISTLISSGKIHKVDDKIYSDQAFTPKLAILTKRYPDAIVTMNSAFYYYSLTDDIPIHYYLVSKRNGTKIKDKQVIQTFEIAETFELGKEHMIVDGVNINIYSKERLLIELVRNKRKLPFDYYKEIISNYRKLVEQMDIWRIEEYSSKMYRGDYIMDTLQMEVF